MSVSVTMPRLGESVTEGTVTRWLKKEGEQVAADEPLLEVSTDKVDTEIPAPASGVLSAIRVAEDETVEVGVELAVIDEAGAAGGSAPAQEAPAQEAPAQEAPAQEAPSPGSRCPGGASPGSPRPGEPGSAGARARTHHGRAAAARPAPATRRGGRRAGPCQQAAGAHGRLRAAARGGATGCAASGRRSAGGDPAAGATVRPGGRGLLRRVRHAAGPEAGGGARRRPLRDQRHRSRRAHPQAGRARGRPVAAAGAGRGGAPGSQPAGSGDGERVPATSPDSPAPGPESPAAAQPQPARVQASPLRGKTEKMSRLRSVIARRMVESLQVSAQLTTVVEVDVTRVARLRQLAKADFERREGVKLSFLPFFAIATVEALKQHPGVNASIDTEAGTITYHEAEHLGVAVDTDRGLLVPVIRDAGDLNLGGMARKIADLAERTRANKVGPDELGGGTFTLTNTGSRGALFDTPIINQPQVGILGTGGVVKRPVVVDDPDLGEVIAVRSMVYLALTYDHRIVDGADAARFLVTVKERLEGGAFEADLGLA